MEWKGGRGRATGNSREVVRGMVDYCQHKRGARRNINGAKVPILSHRKLLHKIHTAELVQKFKILFRLGNTDLLC